MEPHRSTRAKHWKLVEGDPSAIGNTLICWPVAFIVCKELALQTLWRACKFSRLSGYCHYADFFLMGHQWYCQRKPGKYEVSHTWF